MHNSILSKSEKAGSSLQLSFSIRKAALHAIIASGVVTSLLVLGCEGWLPLRCKATHGNMVRSGQASDVAQTRADGLISHHTTDLHDLTVNLVYQALKMSSLPRPELAPFPTHSPLPRPRFAPNGKNLLPTNSKEFGRHTLIKYSFMALVVGAWELCTDAARAQSAPYDEYAATYNELDAGPLAEVLGLPALRRSLVSQARGATLEVAVGTGLNLPLYDRSKVTSLDAVDLSGEMLKQARSASTTVPVALRQADATALPYPDSQFDSVVSTFSLCVFSRPVAVVREMARVLRPGGKLLLLENARAGGVLGAYQVATGSIAAQLSKGCDWSVQPDVIVRDADAGLRIITDEPSLSGLVRTIVAVKDER